MCFDNIPKISESYEGEIDHVNTREITTAEYRG
jgi:hypothetical protein